MSCDTRRALGGHTLVAHHNVHHLPQRARVHLHVCVQCLMRAIDASLFWLTTMSTTCSIALACTRVGGMHECAYAITEPVLPNCRGQDPASMESARKKGWPVFVA